MLLENTWIKKKKMWKIWQFVAVCSRQYELDLKKGSLSKYMCSERRDSEWSGIRSRTKLTRSGVDGWLIRHKFWAVPLYNRDTQGAKLVVYSFGHRKPVQRLKRKWKMVMFGDLKTMCAGLFWIYIFGVYPTDTLDFSKKIIYGNQFLRGQKHR